MSTIAYAPAGPIAKAFHESNAFVKGIRGPIGSSKSVTCCMEILMRALAQERGTDGWARYRAVAIRNTYGELKTTTIRTWLEWFPEEIFGKIRWDSPITHKLDLGDKRTLEVMFLAVDRPEDAKKLLSLETGVVWINEVREIPKAVIDAASGRCGRFPAAKSGVGCYYPGIIMDTNPSESDHWYAKLEAETPETWDFFVQPGGLTPEAENLNWLTQTTETLKLPLDHPNRLAQGRVYYERLVAGKDANWVDVYVNGNFGSISSDRPVFPEFNDQVHASRTILGGYPGLPLYIGVDAGLTPAMVFAQISATGQLRILDELIGENMGMVQFIETLVNPLIAMKYPNYKIISIVDPACTQRAQSDENTVFKILKSRGLNPSTAATNAFYPRREAVAFFLNRLVDGNPAFILSATVVKLRKALNGDYKYQRVQVSGEERYKDQPMKNMSSHVSDSLQYLCLHHHNPGRPEKARAIPSHNKYKSGIAGY